MSRDVPLLLDPGFIPAAAWVRDYRERVVRAGADARPLAVALLRRDGFAAVRHERILPAEDRAASMTFRFVERLLKFLLWQKGGEEILIAGAPEVAAQLAIAYSRQGARAFDRELIGGRVFRGDLGVRAAAFAELPEPREPALEVGGNLDGCRIGFDLGGSDRKAAALIDGEVVFSEEIPWDPYFQQDPRYHVEGVHDSIARAAAHLPRVDAIGGSAAGAYVDNEPRVASLFRGVGDADFERTIRPMFRELRNRWGGVPFQVMNDGEVTALAGSLWLREGSVLGISMGTSQAAGYVTPEGRLTTWLNELAFVPVDFRGDAPRDEWSGDDGCGVQYFSQQAVARLATKAGFAFESTLTPARRLELVQEAAAKGDPRAVRVFETVGNYLGHTAAWYREFYAYRHLVIVGRVVSGVGGALILRAAKSVLRDAYPEIGDSISLTIPDERSRRHGQAIAAASLPPGRRVLATEVSP